MALFSDIDWIIIAVVAVFLLFGRENTQLLRTFGRWYGRALHLKQELLGELTKAVDLPGATGPSLSIRGTLLGLDTPNPRGSGIPTAVRVPPAAPFTPSYDPAFPWTGGYPVPTWSTTVPASAPSGEVTR